MSGLLPANAAPASVAGTLLGGRVFYRQHTNGYRTGLEPVLLAACVPARPGERVVEGGTGAGAGLLCLATRVAGVDGLGVEIDPALASLARENFAANGLGRFVCEAADLAGWRGGTYDHAFANPPWHAADGTPSPCAGRRLAKQAGPGLLAGWAMALAAGLRRGGTLSLILPAGLVAEGVTALQRSGCPQVSIRPLWPRAGYAARLVILTGVRLGGGSGAILPGLVLHRANGGYTEAAESVLRDGLGFSDV